MQQLSVHVRSFQIFGWSQSLSKLESDVLDYNLNCKVSPFEGSIFFEQNRGPYKQAVLYLYRAGRPIGREVLKGRIWGVPPAGGPLL